MYGLTQEEGRFEQLVRAGAMRLARPDIPCNTGTALFAADLPSYLLTVVPAVALSGALIASDLSLLPNQFKWNTGTGTCVLVCLNFQKSGEPLQEPDSAALPATPAGIVTLVRKTFLLNVRDAAAVFGVSRPTIYKWAQLEDFGEIRAKKDLARLGLLHRLAKSWRDGEPLVGDWLHMPLPDGKSVLELLQAETPDLTALLAARKYLQSVGDRLAAEENRRARLAVAALAESMAGFDAAPASPSQEPS